MLSCIKLVEIVLKLFNLPISKKVVKIIWIKLRIPKEPSISTEPSFTLFRMD